VEFDREWNLSSGTRSNEHIVSGIASLNKNKYRHLMLRSDYFMKEQSFSGTKNLIDIDLTHKKTFLKHRASLLNSQFSAFSTTFFSQKGTGAFSAGPFLLGSSFEQEINRFLYPGDSLADRSYSFVEIEPFMSNRTDSSAFSYRIWYKNRQTKSSLLGTMDNAFGSEEAGIRIKTELAPQNTLAFNGVYRVTNVKDPSRTQMASDRSLVSRIENNLRFLKGGITSFFYYEMGSGLETKKEFSYLEVAPGQGQYTWVDYNQNGIREMNEFEPANYQDEASYIRIVFPSNEYIKVYALQCNETFIIEPRKFWGNDTMYFKKLVSRFSNRFQYSVSKKTSSELLFERLTPFADNISDTSLIALNTSMQNTVFFNRAHPIFSGRYRYTDNKNKILLFNGIESRQVQAHEIHFIWNMTKSLGVDFEAKTGSVINNSEISAFRNFNFRWTEFSPVFNLQPSVKKRYSLTGKYRVSESIGMNPAIKAVILSIGPDIRIPVMNNNALNFRVQYHKISYNGTTNTSIAYEMLNSLEPGTNFTWNLMLQLSVSKSLMLNFMYEGRKPQAKKIIHFGSVQLRAIL